MFLLPTAPTWGGAPRSLAGALSCGCGVDTPGWVGTSGLERNGVTGLG